MITQKRTKKMLKKQFFIACASAGINMTQWARQNGVSTVTVCLLLTGKRKSRRLSAKVNDFIATEFKKLGINNPGHLAA
jgi:hypothetical protein